MESVQLQAEIFVREREDCVRGCDCVVGKVCVCVFSRFYVHACVCLIYNVKARDPSLLTIAQTLKMVFNIQSTHCSLSVDKSSSNLIYIPIAERIPLTNHTQIKTLTSRRLQRFAKPFCLLRLHCLCSKYVAFHPCYPCCPHSNKLLRSWVIISLDTYCMWANTHKLKIYIYFSSPSCHFKEVTSGRCHL